MQYQTTLAQAIARLQSGQRITRSMNQELTEQGYDVPSLTQRYFTK